jgi:Flp pilus assembly protein TadD
MRTAASWHTPCRVARALAHGTPGEAGYRSIIVQVARLASIVCIGSLVLATGLSSACGSQTPDPAEPSPDPAAPSADPAEPSTDHEGLENLLAAVDRNPGDAEAHRRLGIALRQRGQLDEAIAHLERATELAPRSLDCLLSLGLGYSAARRLPEARQAYERVLAVSPGHPKALNNLGNVALRQGEEQRAIGMYREAVAADPGYLMAHYRLADALRMTGETDDAYAVYGKVRKLSPTTATEYHAWLESDYQLASIEFLRGEDASVERRLKELVTQVPNHHSAYYLLGQVLVRMGRTDEAQKAIEIHMQIQARRRPSGQDMGG